jgi:hypothetical protein
MLVRYPDGIGREHFYQKRAPKSRPAWIEVVELRFPSGRAADEVVPRAAAALAWLANLKHDRSKSVPLGFVQGTRARWQLLCELGEHGLDRQFHSYP